MKRTLLLSLLAIFAAVPLVACAPTEVMDDPPVRIVKIKFDAYVGDGGQCQATYYVDGEINDTVTLFKTAGADKPNQARWVFEGGDYNYAWVVLENNGLRSCLSDTDDIPKNYGGFRIGADGTLQTVTPTDCAPGEYNYLIRAQKMNGGFCGADPKVKIED